MLAYAGKGTFLVKRLDLNATVEEIAHLLEASISKKIRLAFHLLPDLPGLDADPAQVEQLVLNLITNAADAIGDREGTIRLTTGYLTLTEGELQDLLPGQPLAPGPFLTLEVSDDGSGIPPELLERIFDPFFTTKATGRGLGLSAMLGILRAHGGGIKIASEPGRGSTFRLFLPALPPGPGPGEEHPEALPWKGQGTILVVDDDEEVRATTRAQVASLGFRVLEARDGLEALELFRLRHESIDLVLMDFSMPHLDGREATRAMRGLDPGVRVILCSGFDEGASGGQTEADAPTAFLQKPFRHGALVRVLREALEGKG
jgi:CheY-like chemotaxis protein